MHHSIFPGVIPTPSMVGRVRAPRMCSRRPGQALFAHCLAQKRQGTCRRLLSSTFGIKRYAESARLNHIWWSIERNCHLIGPTCSTPPAWRASSTWTHQKEYFAKETDQNHLNRTRRFAIALKYTIFVSPCTGKERVRNEKEHFSPIRRFRQVAFKMRK